MNDAEKHELLRVAREAIVRETANDNRSVPSEMILPTPGCGLFVTLRNNRRLRGCMGTFSPQESLIETVEHVARSACNDPRFIRTPIVPTEVPEITIEISVLGPLNPTDDPASLRLGEDGILIRRGKASGCFLPHVATEWGWSVEQFLDQCCTSKAGLPAGAWKQSDVEVFLFTAEVFSDET
jgi:uncharacterized protein